jgi:hypothetical protein
MFSHVAADDSWRRILQRSVGIVELVNGATKELASSTPAIPEGKHGVIHARAVARPGLVRTDAGCRQKTWAFRQWFARTLREGLFAFATTRSLEQSRSRTDSRNEPVAGSTAGHFGQSIGQWDHRLHEKRLMEVEPTLPVFDETIGDTIRKIGVEELNQWPANRSDSERHAALWAPDSSHRTHERSKRRSSHAHPIRLAPSVPPPDRSMLSESGYKIRCSSPPDLQQSHKRRHC